MAATDPIASDVGHGTLGFRDNLRPFVELVLESAGQKHVFVELRGSKLVAGWVPVPLQPPVYSRPVSAIFDGVARHVVGVKIPGATLTEVENLAGCITTSGSFFYDGIAWDGAVLYLNLPGGADPTTTDVLVQFGFHYSNVGMEIPLLGPDRLVDGGIEVWTSASDALSWSENAIGAGGPGAGSVNQDLTFFAPDGGIYSARMEGPWDPSNGGQISQVVTFTDAGLHSFSGWYRTDLANDPAVKAQIAVSDSASRWLQSDGRNYSASQTFLNLTPTYGAWRRFVFHVWISTTGIATVHAGGFNTSGGVLNGKVWFDGLRFSRISRFAYYEPALALDSVPSVDIQRADRFFGRFTTGLGTLSLLNTAGRMESLLGSFGFLQQRAYVRIGGRFGDGGNEILAEDLWLAYTANMSKPRVNDSIAAVDLEDAHTIWNSPLLPLRTYTAADFPNLASLDDGRVRPYVFGSCPHSRPAQVDTISGLGQYEIADPLTGAHALGGPFLVAPTTPRAYEDFQAGDEGDTTRAVVPVAVAEWTFEAPTAQMHFIFPVGPIRITDGQNDRLDFISNSVTRVATLATGLYRVRGATPSLLILIRDAMRAATGASDVNVTYDALNAFTISYSGAGNFQLLLGTGANKHRSVFALAGFIGDTDLTGAITYTGITPIAAYAQRSLRADLSGYIDDTAGTYTGTPSASIAKAADILYFLFRQIIGMPVERLDLPSFVAARASSPQVLAAYIGALGSAAGPQDFGAIVEMIEASTGLDLVLDGDIFRLRQRDNTTPAGILDLYDRDFLSFEAWNDVQDVYAGLRHAYSRDPSTGFWTTYEQYNQQAALRYGRPDPLVFETYLASLGDVLARHAVLYPEATTPPIRYAFEVKGSCLKKLVGDKVRLNRTNMLGGSGKVVRIQRKRDDMQTWVSSIEAVEVLVTTPVGTVAGPAGQPENIAWPPPTGTFDGAWDMGA